MKNGDMLLLSFGWDGDSLVKSAMKQSVSLLSLKEPLLNNIPSSPTVPRIPSNWKEWFQMYPRSTISYVQDTVHVGDKLKSRLLKPSILLPMGPHFCASGNLLRIIKTTYSKDEHNLREHDVNYKDKQNFNAVLHNIIIMNLCDLLNTIPEAKATFVYIEMMKCTIDSYLDKSLSPLERIEKAWYANFFTRYWDITKRPAHIEAKLPHQQRMPLHRAQFSFFGSFLMNARDNVEKVDVVFYHGCLDHSHVRKHFGVLVA